MFDIEREGGRKEKLRVWGIADDMPVGKVIELVAKQLNENAEARQRHEEEREYY
ncbi:hypothetical protein [Pelagibacterium luteolum]|uniref:Uncharacterized protein n=1 Tax=Pelagibacterium luteolum TaxID=440168 RepID=A0A1G7ZNE2_9HYPH|nr:hypothetical protein [Pelagibacterium luteolum]SDH09620.1 hypothetical protein SAMN04487974_1212 [Pelagibacterium luteolum]